MAPPKKTIEQYEAEAEQAGECLIHPAARAARKVYQLRHGTIDNPKLAVCHTCDNPKCIEDKHHWLGSWGDNVRDAVAKGRHSCFKNCAKKGEGFRGGSHSDTTKKKIGQASKRLWASYTNEERAKRVEHLLGNTNSVGKKHNEAFKEKQRANASKRARISGRFI